MNQKSSRRAKVRFSLFLLLALLCVYFFLHGSFFKVDKVYVSGNSKITVKEITGLAGIKNGVNIFLINDSQVARAVENHPLIKSASIVRHLPRKVEIKIQERKIWALVPCAGSLICIDRDGICLDKVTELSLLNDPVITFDRLPSSINLGQAVNPAGTKAIGQVWDALSAASKKEVSQFHYSEKAGEIVMYTQRGTEIRWGKSERNKEKAAYLEQVFGLEKDMDDKGDNSLEYVDLRFQGQPVLKSKISGSDT